VPFRAPPGIVLVRVNHKTGLATGAGDKTAVLEAFKPGQEPSGSVVDEGDAGDVAGDDYGQPTGAVPQPPPPFGPANNDRALTSGTGGLY
jgi:penicillin-binding protein 1A